LQQKKAWQERKKELKRWGNLAVKRYREKQKAYLKRVNDLRVLLPSHSDPQPVSHLNQPIHRPTQEARLATVELKREVRGKTAELKALDKQLKELTKEAEKKSQLIEALESEIARLREASGYVLRFRAVRSLGPLTCCWWLGIPRSGLRTLLLSAHSSALHEPIVRSRKARPAAYQDHHQQ